MNIEKLRYYSWYLKPLLPFFIFEGLITRVFIGIECYEAACAPGAAMIGVFLFVVMFSIFCCLYCLL